MSNIATTSDLPDFSKFYGAIKLSSNVVLVIKDIGFEMLYTSIQKQDYTLTISKELLVEGISSILYNFLVKKYVMVPNTNFFTGVLNGVIDFLLGSLVKSATTVGFIILWNSILQNVPYAGAIESKTTGIGKQTLNIKALVIKNIINQAISAAVTYGFENYITMPVEEKAPVEF